jgi:hypothetical protein
MPAVGYEIGAMSLTLPVGFLRREDFKDINASSSMRSFKDDFGSNSYLVANSMLG